MRFRKELILIVLTALVTLFSGAGSGLCADPITPKITCDETLQTGIGKVSFVDGNGQTVTITSVTHKTATASTPAYCEVKGYRQPMDLFIVALPDSWNGTYWQTGNGGAAGSLGNITTGIQGGYVSASGSGGHDVSQEIGQPTFSWAYPPGNLAAAGKLNDYCYGSVHLTKLLALDMITAYYGIGVKPIRSYYNSCSTGGRQGLLEAQRYPDDFDGLVIGAPVHYLSSITQRGVWERQALATDPWTATGGSIAPKLPLLATAVIDKCDSIDGLVDGFIDDPRKCTFNPLRDLPACAGNVDAATCFTKAQREIIKKIYSGPPGLAFSEKYPSHAYSSEMMAPPFAIPLPSFISNWQPWIVPWAPFGPVSLGFDLGGGWVQWVGLPPSGLGGPNWDWTTYSWTGGDPQRVVHNTSAKCDAIDPDLSVLKQRGAKIIHYDGWPDPATGAFMTVKYYDEVLDLMGDESTKDFYKLYMIPGMGHCGGGIGCGTVNWQTYIEDWVERDLEPGAIIGSRAEKGTPGTADYFSARTRPLCPYPEVARYLGTGSIDDQVNFTCVKTVAANVRVEPETLNLNKNGTFTAFITLPHHRDCEWHHRGHGGHDGDRDWHDLQIQAVVCEGAPGRLVKKGDTYIAKFDAKDLINVRAGESVAFTVSLIAEHDGKQVAFEGSDTVRVK